MEVECRMVVPPICRIDGSIYSVSWEIPAIRRVSSPGSDDNSSPQLGKNGTGIQAIPSGQDVLAFWLELLLFIPKSLE